MDIENIKIGFIGAGYMGYGMAHNLLKNKIPLSVIAHKNRKPIEKLVQQGALESKSLKDVADFSNVIIICVSNTLVAIEIINKILPYINTGVFINNKLVFLSKEEIISKLNSNEINGDSDIINITIKSKKDYEEKWILKIKESWLKNFLAQKQHI